MSGAWIAAGRSICQAGSRHGIRRRVINVTDQGTVGKCLGDDRIIAGHDVKARTIRVVLDPFRIGNADARDVKLGYQRGAIKRTVGSKGNLKDLLSGTVDDENVSLLTVESYPLRIGTTVLLRIKAVDDVVRSAV